MRYCLTFLMFGTVFVVVGVAAWEVLGWFAVLFFYPGLSMLLLALAYGKQSPQLLGKKETGSRTLLGWVLFAPYFLLNHMTFRLYRLMSREPAFVEVAPNLYLGRRLTDREAQGVSWASVLDLAVEFDGCRWERTVNHYRSLPVLDTMAPTEAEVHSATAWIAERIAAGPVYVHCALGHGRSACVVVAYLLSIRAVPSMADGIRLVRSLRSGVRLNRMQKQRLRGLEVSLTQSQPGV